MDNKKILTSGALLIAMAAVLGVVSITLAANEQSGANTPARSQKNCKWQVNAEQREAKNQAVKAALDNSDYQAWLQAVGSDSAQAKVITADNFSQLVAAHKLVEEGRAKLEEARKIHEELGLPAGPGRMEKKGPPPADENSSVQ